ncbi:hypothetical protein BU24DRAFT_450052 [Aaosphaeria arxii CBS 175.79]|uniref:Rap-GAP domain-containing protein n=1 Tax=Aaosphaeria arxii CBS 175.79 TaxID=1450172 RepID=A0A6A5XPY4_9PLEO|nr:uncharacterized protein BU24DRAFT_450052 [Aaosphaeria arxii CBS 175.79]KAF2015308.1 hypothetical protein BU24DRAFT_450052 [Aaosphaeria arxii CBS 175.79]
MSPTSGNDPRTPDRRSSSAALLGAFRSLTGGRLKSPTPPASVSSATGTPVRSGSIASHQKADPVVSAPPTVAEVHSVVKQPTQNNVLGSKRAPMGGPPEFEDLVARLHTSQPFAERAAAVEKICEILKEYPVRNVLGLWAAASDLMLPEKSEEAAEVAYTLLKGCVALPDLNAVERNVFFGAANLRQNDRRFDLRLDIISTLTNGGRNVEACESLLAPFILTSIHACFQERFNASSSIRRPSLRKGSDQPTKESQNMTDLFHFITDTCKFNSKVFTEDDLVSLLHHAMAICQGTTHEADIENVIKLFDTIITYVHIPSRSLKPGLEVLCIIHRQLERLQEQSWNTLVNLFQSHVGQAAVSALLHTLLDGANRKSRKFSAYRAAIQVLQRLLLEDGQNGLPTVPISLLFPALKSSIKEEHQTQESFVISLIATMLSDDRIRSLLLNEGDWSDLIQIIHTCASRSDEREAALAAALAERVAGERTGSIAGTGSHTAGTAGAALSTTSTGGEVESESMHNGDPLSAPLLRNESTRRGRDDEITNIFVGLNELGCRLDPIHKAAIMELLAGHFDRLTDVVAEATIKYHIDERTFFPSNPDWLEACRRLVSGVLKDTSRPRALRILTIKTLRDVHNTVEHICPGDLVLQCTALLLNNIETEADVEVLNELVDFAVDVADRASDDSFPDLASLLKRRIDREKPALPSQMFNFSPWSGSFQSRVTDHHLGSASNVISTAFVRLFTRSVIQSARKTRQLYEILRSIVASDACENDARLTALKLLFRLRADSNHAISVNPSSEGESIAAVLCRTEETAVSIDKFDDTSSDHGKSEDYGSGSWRDQRKTSGNSPHSSLNRYTGRQGSTPGRASKPIPPLWMYPGPKGLPEEPSPQSSRVVFAHIDQEEYPLPDDILDMEITLWLELVISLMQNAPDWEIYSYVLVHLGPQLSNQALVRSCVPQLKMLRNVTCEQIRSATFREPPSHTLLKKADVAVCMFHILTMLISYHDYYEKSEEDDVVKAFLHGIGHWDRTSIWCIHALTVCCHEMPLSVSKSLDNIIQKLSQIITKPATAIHILEFLTSLGRMPELLKNFREEDFKMVFGVSFNYLRHVRDQRERAASVTAAQLAHRSIRHAGAPRESTTSPDNASAHKAKPAEEDLPQYVYSLAYHVITFWFMALKMEERPKLLPWITRNLQYTDTSGRQVMEEQAQVIADMMSMTAYSDRDDTARNPEFSEPGDGEIWKKTWIMGHSLITIETAARTGVSLTTTRRPCGTRHIYSKPLLTNPPPHQVPITIGLAYEAWNTASYVGILPDDLFNTYYAHLSFPETPVQLPDDQMARRAIEAFDRNSTVDGYSVGVVYIGDGQMGQKHEKAILLIDNGSAAYTSFLSDLGTLVRLKGAKINTHGLDVRNDNDGEYTYCWRDRCMELVFHIPTMMPTPESSDEVYASKKRHIGNDFVNIIFNDSGLNYDFNTFPSAFNYVAIVIAPEARASFVDRRLDSDPEGKSRYYKVQVISKPGFPDISPAVEPKIICGKHLAAYCRLLAINASVFSQVWSQADGGESISSWRNRLRQIKALKERYGGSDASATASPTSPINHQIGSNPPSRENGVGGFKRTSVATFLSEGTNRSSLTSGSHDVAL